MSEGTWTIRPCPHRQASALAQELGLSEITASVLVRRGYGDPDEARAFLAGEQPLHDPSLLGDMKEAVARIRAAIAAGTRICVHGDYDVDGICATALALLILREVGADAAWHLPSRFDEGYGVSGQTLERLAEDGCGLVLTVDCGITAVDEVTRARELGLDVIVTDHHRPAERLPECPLVVTRPSTYPFPDLCGTGVVYKLGQALLGADSETLRRHVDLVALATIADVVPLVGENRPVVLIAGTDGLWKGSGRSIPSFDLHAALNSCARFLERFGGHRAAAGLSIVPEWIEPFADAFAAEAERVLAPDDLVPTTIVDAVLPRGAKLTLDLCEELRRLAPFGLGNPDVTLLAPGCELGDLAAVGDGKHLRFRVQRDGCDAGGAIAFGQGTQLDRYRRVGRYDVAFRLQANQWNGTVAPQLVVRRVFDADDRFDELYTWLRTQWEAQPRDPQAQTIFDELEVEAGGPKRHPLESETFRALLGEPAMLRAA